MMVVMPTNMAKGKVEGCSIMMFFGVMISILSALPTAQTFMVANPSVSTSFRLHMAGGVTTTSEEEKIYTRPPQVFATGYSDNDDLTEAVIEATNAALVGLPKRSDSNVAQSIDEGDDDNVSNEGGCKIDLGMVYVSSLYDLPSTKTVIPTIISTIQNNFQAGYLGGIKRVIGCSAAGMVSCKPDYSAHLNEAESDDDEEEAKVRPMIQTVENESNHGVSITFALLPDVEVKTFHVASNDVPDDMSSSSTLKSVLGLGSWSPSDFKLPEYESTTDEEETVNEANFLILPAPAFQTKMKDFLQGIDVAFPKNNIFGGLSSTVSSLSRALLFLYDDSNEEEINSGITQTLTDGCVGIVLSGDIEMRTMINQGTKHVGATYRVVAGEGSTIKAIVLDETSKDLEKLEPAYLSKASIPKPVLAEANFLLKTLTDDDAAFMRSALLVGVEQGGNLGRSPSELERLAKGEGHQYSVYQVASAGMKDGSVTLPLGSVDVEEGTRIRFYVRDGEAAKDEIAAILKGYSIKVLEEAFVTDGRKTFNPTGAIVFPTLDRGTRLFGGKAGYESSKVSDAVPALQSISGFFCNGVIGKLNGIFQNQDSKVENTMVHGNASGYAMIGSKSKRPFYDAAAEAGKTAAKDAPTTMEVTEEVAPRQPNGELVVRRREIQSGRLMTVSTVQWSVAEKMAVPTSMFEGFMWDKETEVDRFRERVPLANLLSQVKLAMSNPSTTSPRGWTSHIKKAVKENGFVIVGEVKRSEPNTGSIWKRYNAPAISSAYVRGGSPVVSVNCDKCFFGGTIEDVSQVRMACPETPILASDLILYPYQVYKLYLAGCDAVTLTAAALEEKDLLYLVKIVKTLKMETILSVTSEVQLRSAMSLSEGMIDCLTVSNRDLESFGFDMSGQQALSLLKSDTMKEFRGKHADVPILLEGRIGIIGANDSDSFGTMYLKSAKDEGAVGAIVGQGLALINEEDPASAINCLADPSNFI